MGDLRRVRVLINPKSGTWWSSGEMQQILGRVWDRDGIHLSYQFSNSVEDGQRKTQRAIDDHIDTLLVVGGDGMVNTIGSILLGSDVSLGVIPAGSGNGFARHFGIPLTPAKAAEALFDAEPKAIDVGTANGRPFFVTCSMAWDAAMVRTYEKSPIRGILPYVFAGVQEYIEYRPQPFRISLDGGDPMDFPSPVIFTVANLTQYGGGAQIAPTACPDDGMLELVVVSQPDALRMIVNASRLFDGTIDKVKAVKSWRFKELDVKRKMPAPIQFDGEVIDADKNVSVRVLPKALTVLVPRE
ncbi:MAG: diacylglycerol kinase family lipid kinase [Verrucomicrobia bacterium]|nr:diacylglycerol kinase family lipid kinase [Verrucomicrobiota bacterium]